MRHFKTAAMGAVLAIMATNSASAALTMVNGSFETIGVQYNPALGGLHEATGWTNLSGLNIQASSMLEGQELTPLSPAGARILRLVSDNPHPVNTGAIVQNLGTMIAGETYRFTADALGGGSVGHAWGATASFVSQASTTPAITYASMPVDGIAQGVFAPNAFNLYYTAKPADNGNPLFVLLAAKPSGGGQATRGGVDNAQIATVTAGVMTLVNGSFELPTPVTPGSNFDTVTPTGWTFAPAAGLLAYPRVGSGGFAYPAAADGTTIYAVEGERGGVLFQDLGVMKAGEKYTIEGTVMRAALAPSYRASLIGDPFGAALELAFITEANFNPAASSSLLATFSYTATAADAGKLLRLALSDNGTTAPTRSAFDKLSITVSVVVPEPATAVLCLLAGLAPLHRRRRVA